MLLFPLTRFRLSTDPRVPIILKWARFRLALTWVKEVDFMVLRNPKTWALAMPSEREVGSGIVGVAVIGVVIGLIVAVVLRAVEIVAGDVTVVEIGVVADGDGLPLGWSL